MSILGKLERVDLRKEWPGEASHFTPWLAQEENLALLGETLCLELELEGQERAVGPFRADILCKDVGFDQWVLIENQLGRTDHTHLGQIMTYAAGLNAATIVWVAAAFTQEHRETLDWLNRITEDGFRFFGLEVELWRIGDSLSAPRFNIVSQPNDWAREVKQAAKRIDSEDLSDLRLMQQQYWTGVQTILMEKSGPLSGNRKPHAGSWMSYPLGRSGTALDARISRPQNCVQTAVYLSTEKASVWFDNLYEQRDEIESALGFELNWLELSDGKRDRRIVSELAMEEFADKGAWQRQHRWIADRLNAMHRVFSPKVRLLE